MIWLAVGWIGRLIDYLMGWLPGWLEWLGYLVWPLFALLALVVVFYGFSIVANLIAAPFNGLLAEMVEKDLTGEPVEGDWKQVVRDILPAIWSEVRKLVYFVLRAAPLGILFLIPGVNLAAPFLWVLFSAWMMAIQYVDYPMGNHQLFFKDQRRRLRQRRLQALGFGGLTMLLTLIPVINFFIMPAAVAGATAMWVNDERLRQT
jgi:CysZ protein